MLSFHFTWASFRAAVTINDFVFRTILPSKCNSLTVACTNQLGSNELFINTIEMLFTWTAINCAKVMMLGGTFLFRKSNSFCFAMSAVGKSSTVGPSLSGVVAGLVDLISLLTRMSRMLIDNSLVTSELKKLLRMQISSICYNKLLIRINNVIANEIIVQFFCVKAFITYQGISILKYFNVSQ